MKETLLRIGSYLLVAVLATVLTLTMVHLEVGLKPSKLEQLESLIQEKFIGEADPGKLADAAAEEGPDDFEAPGIAHMKDTKKERNSLIQPIVHDKNKARGADNVGYRVGYNGTNGTIYGGNVTPMDVSVDNASYLEALMEKGLITPEQYKEARRAFSDGVTLGRNDYLDDLYERESGRDL